jgi:hypothetical protein
MGFNLGAFAGGLAQGGVSGYKTMEDIQSQKKRDELVELQAQQMKTDMQGKEALRAAIAEQGDMNTVTPGAMMAGPAPQGLPQEGGYMTPEVAASEKLARVRQRALEGGADPTAVMQYANAQRADTSAFNTDKAFEWMRGVDKTVTEKGLAKAAEEHLIPEYNKNKGTLNDGLTANLVNDKKGTFVQFKDKDGKVVRTEPLNMQTFNAARDEVGASMLAAAGPEHFYKSREYGLKSREVGAKEALIPSEIAKNNAVANQANAHASVFSNMLQASKDNKAAGEAMKPFIDKFSALTPEQQAGSEGQALLMQGATAGAKVSKDLTGLVTMLRKPDNAAVSPEMRTQAYTELANAGTSPEAVRAVKAKWPEVFGPSALDKAIAARANQKPAADVAPAKPASALPVIKTPDFKVSGGRGQYAVSGLPTKFGTRADAEAAARKAQLGSREAEVAATLERDQ